MKKLINLTMFDLFKGVAMLLVLFGHSFVYNNGALGELVWGRIVLSVLMPAFFLVSGYWLKKKSVKAGIKSGFEFLIKPFLLFALAIIVIGFLHRALSGELQEWVRVFLIPTVLVSTKSGSRIGPMWFVFALFLAWCIFYVVVNLKKEKLQLVIAVLSAILGGAIMPLKLPYQLAQGLVAFFFVYCGYLWKKKKVLEMKIHPLFYLLMIAMWVISIIYGSMDLHDYDMKYGLFSAAGSLCGAFILIKVFLYLNLLEWSILDGVRWLGRYSMWIITIHAIENAIFPWKILFGFVEEGSWIGILVHFALRLLFIVVACLFLQKIQMYRIKIKNKKGEKEC